MKLIFSLIKRHLIGFFSAIMFLVIEAVCDLLQPTMMSKIVDEGVALNDMSTVSKYGLIMLLIALAGAGGAVLRNIFASIVSQKIGKELRFEIYSKVLTYSHKNIDKLEPASLVTRLTNDVTQIQNFINGCMRILVKAPITCIGAIILIITQVPHYTPVVAVILSIAAILIVLNMKLGYPRFGKVQKMLDKLNTVSREYLSSIRVVKAFGRETHEYQRFSDSASSLASATVSASRVNASFFPAIHLTVNLGIIGVLWISGYNSAIGNIQVGSLMATVNYMTQMLFSLSMISNILNVLVRATASSERIKEVLDEVPAISDPKYNQNPVLSDGIEFKNVSFSYNDTGSEALSDISFKAKSGSTVGIIGSTGSGKTTLVNLMLRFYDVNKGEVLIGGKNVKDIRAKTLRGRIAIVPQKSLLFTGTIIDNLRWGDKNATEEKIYAAAKASCADDFIRPFPKGYRTLLGQGGVNVSGGQKQRLSIARALIRKPDILILDDSTSALDATTEQKVREGIRKYIKNITTFIISQRISSIITADKILVLDDGRIVGQGSHIELIKDCKIYQDIYRSQIGGVEIG